MDLSKVGKLIYTLRKEKDMTQKQVADLMHISDKAISKWERGLGCPDVSLLPELSQILGVNIEGILLGTMQPNETVGGNMKKIKFYVCPQCGNLLNSTGEADISCCGKRVEALVAMKADEEHRLTVEPIEDELYITSPHSMRKEHYLTFVAYVTGDKVFLAKQYPEWDMQFCFHKYAHGKLYFHCSKDGLYYQLI